MHKENQPTLKIRSAFNKFPDFSVQAFKIVVDSGKFSVLLLYILWLIFMISGSNEQLQQELEYTLLKPHCHSWWISKMQSDTLEERYAIRLCFKIGRNVTETYGMPQTAFRPSCINRLSVFEWHKRFKEGKESVRDDERCRSINTVPQPPYSPDLTPCDFWLFPKLTGRRYETTEEMKEAVTNVIDTLTQEDFDGPCRSC